MWPKKTIARRTVPLRETKLGLVMPVSMDDVAHRILPERTIPRSALIWSENAVFSDGHDAPPRNESVTAVAVLPNFHFQLRLWIHDTTLEGLMCGEKDEDEREEILRDFLGRIASSLDYWYRIKYLISKNIGNGGYENAQILMQRQVGSLVAPDAVDIVKAIVRMRENALPKAGFKMENDLVRVTLIGSYDGKNAVKKHKGMALNVLCRNHAIALALAHHFAVPEFTEASKFKGQRFTTSKDVAYQVSAQVQEVGRWGKTLEWKPLKVADVEGHILRIFTQQDGGMAWTDIKIDDNAPSHVMNTLKYKWPSASALAVFDYHTDYPLYYAPVAAPAKKVNTLMSATSSNKISLLRDVRITEGGMVWFTGVVGRHGCGLLTTVSTQSVKSSASLNLKRTFEVSRSTEEQGDEKRLKVEPDDDDDAIMNDLIDIPDEEAFLAQMNTKLLDPKKPLFTLDEVTRYYTVITRMPTEGSEEFIREYCMPRLNEDRDDGCFFK